MVSQALPLEKRKVIVCGDSNCFYRTIAMSIDEKEETDGEKSNALYWKVSVELWSLSANIKGRLIDKSCAFVNDHV